MILTEDNVEIPHDNDEYYFEEVNEAVIIYGDAKEIKQQILSNQEKAEKWDNVKTVEYEYHLKLQQENKELKEQLGNCYNDEKRMGLEIAKLKEIVDWFDDRKLAIFLTFPSLADEYDKLLGTKEEKE